MIHYTTAAKEAHAEQIITKSRFIGHVCPVTSREEAESFFAGIKAKYKDASHNVPAFVIGEKGEVAWTSDDGEPQGTAGPPVLQMLQSEGLTNIAVVITRYFGGTKLGTGGLVRAYTGTAKLVLEEAGLRQVRDYCIMRFELAYTLLGKLQNNEKSMPFSIEEINYSDTVEVVLSCEEENADAVKSMLSDLSGGAVMKSLSESFEKK